MRNVAAPPIEVAPRAYCREILGRALQNGFQLLLRLVELTKMKQRSAERDASRQVAGMSCEAAAADLDGFLMKTHAPAFFGELGKRDRRRIRFDPASKIFQSVRHPAPREGRGYLEVLPVAPTTTVLKTLLLWPASSVTPRTIV